MGCIPNYVRDYPSSNYFFTFAHLKVMNKKSILYAVAFMLMVVSVSLFSCVKDIGPLPVQKSVTFCDSLNVKWSTDIQPIIQANCAFSGCHSAGASMGDFTAYAGVKAKVDNGSLNNRVIIQKNMPSSGPLPNSLIQKIDCWIQKGAQNN